ncbi:MAG: flavodoxin family protein [Chloroflexota bacterium]
MKVLGLVCSPRKGGNTEIMVGEALDAVRELGGETELVTLAGKTITPCDACAACRPKGGTCHVKDDMQEVYQQLINADGIIFGSPVYFGNVSAQAKAVMDRTYAMLHQRQLRNKVAAAIVVTRRVGAGQARGLLYNFFIAHRMLVAGGGIGYGRDKGEVRTGVGGSQDRTALQEARGLGHAIVALLKQLGK